MFTKVCQASAIEEEQSKSCHHDGINFFIVRKDGVLYAYQNKCPHLGIPLEMMPDEFLDNEKALIQCSTHHALFLIDSGLCVSGPCINQSLLNLPVREHEGDIEVDLTQLL